MVPVTAPLVSALAAARAILTESHLLHDFLEVGMPPERIKARILGQGEQLHIALVASSIKPCDSLMRLAESGVGCGNIVGGRALVSGSSLEFV